MKDMKEVVISLEKRKAWLDQRAEAARARGKILTWDEAERGALGVAIEHLRDCVNVNWEDR